MYNINNLPKQLQENPDEIWTFLTKNGIINTDNVLNIIMANKKEQVRKLHPYNITPPAKEGGRWQTYYRDEKGIRTLTK